MQRIHLNPNILIAVGLSTTAICLTFALPAVLLAEDTTPSVIKPDVSSSNPIVNRETPPGMRVLIPEKGSAGLDLTNTIGMDIWEPRSCRAENGDYYVVDQTAENFPFTNIQLHVYRSTGDPHQYPWEYVVGFENTSGYDLYNHDIEIVSSANYGFLIYSKRSAP